MNQSGHGVSHVYLECIAKEIFAIALLGKKKGFSYGSLRISRITNFKNRSFSSGQGVVQSEPNWVLSIPWVPRI